MRAAFKRILSTLHIAIPSVLMFVMVAMSMLAVPQGANAQLVVANPDLLAQEIQRQITEKAEEGIYNALETSAMTALVNVYQTSVNQLAAATAIWVASGGNAGTPLFNNATVGDYGVMVAAQVAAQTIDNLDVDSISGGVVKGFNVTVPDDPAYYAALRRGIRETYQPEASFDFRRIANNYTGFLLTLGESDLNRDQRNTVVLSTLVQSLRSNDLSNGLQIYAGTIIQSNYEQNLATQQQLLNNGFTDKRSAISGRIETPASLVQDQLNDAVQRVQDTPLRLVESALGGSNIYASLGAYGVNAFATALGPVLLQRLYTGIFSGHGGVITDPFNPDSADTSNRDRVTSLLNGLLTYKPVQSSDFSIVSQLSTCPQSAVFNSREIFSCALDSSFAAAVARAEIATPMTLEEAIEEGYINGNWSLIPSADIASNQRIDCYRSAFCYANIVKLRKARIVPVGWEIAAESPANNTANPVTLKTVMDGFQDCNANGELDEDHPWCKLIDPNWVLKAPDSQCRMLAPGETLATTQTADRAEVCADVQTCIAEDENGNCIGGYGYCVREQNTWDFRGESCPAQYASCLSFTDSDGENVDYLVNTVDYGECDADDVGCLWRATEKRQQPDGSFDWPAVASLEDADTDANANKNRIYFNSSVEDCAASDAGCSELVIRSNNQTLNLIQNPSFELDTNQDSIPDGWLFGTFEEQERISSSSRSGSKALAATQSNTRQYVRLNQNRLYTFSYYFGTGSTSFETSQVSLTLTHDTDLDGNAGVPVNLTGLTLSGDCSLTDQNVIVVSNNAQGSELNRATCTFGVPTLAAASAGVDVEISVAPNGGVYDDFKLEQSAVTTDFSVGYSDATAVEYLKVAPDYLGCTGGPDDPEECGNYAEVCDPSDAGCKEYTPTNNGPAVTGIISTGDLCPAVCAGYDTYKQEPTFYEPAGIFPLHFIPSTAETCNESAVGCTEFTNLETEEREYFTYLRSCVERDSTTAESVFYTWEGTDVDGFQLKTWNLLNSNVSDAPCTQWLTNPDGVTCVEVPGSVVPEASCDEYEDIFTNPDCREFYDAEGGIHYREWSKTVTVAEACTPYRMTQIDSPDLNGNGSPVDELQNNCEASGGYYDASNGDCQFFGLDSQSLACDDNENGCRAYTGGRSGNTRTLLQETFEDESLAAFEGNIAISEDSIAANGRSMRANGEIGTFIYDSGTICENDGGCPSVNTGTGASCVVAFGQRYCGTLSNDVFEGKSYTLEFWARGTGSLRVGLGFGSATIDVPFEDSVALSPEWRRYSVGPLIVPEGANTAASELIFFHNGSGDYFLDTIYLQEGEDQITLIAGSWNTPAQCDVNFAGQYVPQFHLGCSEYTTNNNTTAYIRQFSKLCSDDAVGCTGYFDTHESNSTSVEVRSASCSTIDGSLATQLTDCHLEQNGQFYDTTSQLLCQILPGQSSCTFDIDMYLPLVARETLESTSHIQYDAGTQVVPADDDLYLIPSQQSRCSSTGAGCTELGEFTLAEDHSTIEGWNSNYLLNDPDQYDTILCNEDQLFCEAFDAGERGTYYFKDPAGKTCEYKTDVKVGATVYDGWFVTGTNEFCYGNGSCTDDGSSCTTDSDCRVDTGSCSVSGNACSTDFDCSAAETCEGISTATCTITEGSYIVGGEISGAWKNGDAAYDGWVATCSPEFNLCSEFQDPLDYDDDEFYGETQGAVYNFVNNGQLEDKDLLASQRCNGLISQEEGCVLFDDTSDTRQSYSASASYVASANNDILTGGQKFDLVKPIDCSLPASQTQITNSDSETYDLCSQRCVYRNDQLDPINGDSTGSVTDVYTFGGSCVTNNDCSNYESTRGDVVRGQCVTEVSFTTDAGTQTTEDVPRLENDTNRVLKVQRDRMCSEWLTCKDGRTVWDEDTNSFTYVCSDVDLCSGFAGTGDSTFCTDWDSNDPAIVFDAARYSERDVSWYGEEYSGYAIPDLFPVQYLDQVNIAPEVGTCYFPDDPENPSNGLACGPNFTCGGEENSEFCVRSDDEIAQPQYSLGMIAGQCEANSAHGESCTVGYCSDSGSACTTDDNCADGGGSCVIGSCFQFIEGSVCSSDSNCGSGQLCIAGTCAVDPGNATCSVADGLCRTPDGVEVENATCVPSDSVKQGACYSDLCVLTPDGNTFNTETKVEQLCRAYPETNSPFPNEVVTSWTTVKSNGNLFIGALEDIGSALFGMKPSADGSNQERGGVVEGSVKTGFQGTNLCAAGEICECSYTKVTTSAGQSAYVGIDTDLDKTDVKGICQGGDLAGALCYDDADCSVEGGIEGNCTAITREDDVIGLPGYCLEYDVSINILGDQTKQACLTWLPVDQLAGASDLNAKFRDAGYNGGETNYCAYIAPYISAKSSVATAPTNTEDWGSNRQNGQIACINRDDNGGPENSLEACIENVETLACPPGFYAIVGRSGNNDSDPATFANMCTRSGDGTDRGCPFVCVPNDAVVASDDPANGVNAGESCFDAYVGRSVTTSREMTAAGQTWTTDFYYYGNGLNGDLEFNDAALGVQNCVADGYEITDAGAYTVGSMQENAGGSEGWSGFFSGNTGEDVYLGCRDLVQVDNGEYVDSAAYTDRLLNPNSGFNLEPVNQNNAAKFSSNFDTEVYPFGASENPDDVNSLLDPRPSRVASCYVSSLINAGLSSPNPSSDGSDAWAGIVVPELMTSCGSLGSAVTGVVLNNPPARAFVNFIYRFKVSTNGKSLVRPTLDNPLATVGAYRSIEGDGNVDLNNDWQNSDEYTSDTTNALAGIQQLFATSTGLTRFISQTTDAVRNFTRGEYENIEISGANQNLQYGWDNRQSGEPPKIFAVNTSTCRGTLCEEGAEGRLTLNDRDFGEQEGSNGFFRANLKFFMAANKDQLPIRRLVIDWGDGAQVGGDFDDNFYKNHRGLVEGSTGQSKCDTDSEWGMTSESCDQNYLNYTHTYQCSPSITADMEQCTGDPAQDADGCKRGDGEDAVCVYIPRVHIRDNWGWCASSTDDGSDGEADGGHWDNSPHGEQNNDGICNYTQLVDSGSKDPWVYYGGEIVVSQ